MQPPVVLSRPGVPGGQRGDGSLKSDLAAGRLTIGSWLSFGHTQVAEIMAGAGFDWLVVDMEHTAIGVAEMLRLIQIIELGGCTPLVRVGANDPLIIKRALDAGARGIIVPQVNSVEDARRAADSVYYPPRGSRGAGLGRAHGYGLDFAAYKEWADREVVLAVQIEHIRGVEQLENILAVQGVDAFMVGPYDLSGSLGSPGNWNAPPVVEALEEVERVGRLGIKSSGIHVVHSDHAELRRRIEEGFTFIAYGDDMVFLAEKLKEESDMLKRLGSDG